jgi:hypothetical protein
MYVIRRRPPPPNSHPESGTAHQPPHAPAHAAVVVEKDLGGSWTPVVPNGVSHIVTLYVTRQSKHNSCFCFDLGKHYRVSV